MEKRVGILFSGGLDSTYLIYKNLKEGNTVVPIYIEILNNESKSILEKNRIELLYKEFSKQFNNGNDYYNSKIKSINYVLKYGLNYCSNTLIFQQIPIWILGLVSSQCLDIDEFQIGYVSNDDAVAWVGEIESIYKSYEIISNYKFKPISFPLLKECKELIFKELPYQYQQLIVSCEQPNILNKDSKIVEYEPCGECAACKRIINSNYYGSWQMPDIYEKIKTKQSINYLKNQNYKIFNKDNIEVIDKIYKLESKPIQLKLDLFDNCYVENRLMMPTEFKS